jgi:hypothetical protein
MVLRRTPNCDVHHIFIYFIYAEISLMQQMSAFPESGRFTVRGSSKRDHKFSSSPFRRGNNHDQNYILCRYKEKSQHIGVFVTQFPSRTTLSA